MSGLYFCKGVFNIQKLESWCDSLNRSQLNGWEKYTQPIIFIQCAFFIHQSFKDLVNSIVLTFSFNPHYLQTSLASPLILSHLLSLNPTLPTLRSTGIASHRIRLNSLAISLTGLDHFSARMAGGMRPARKGNRCDVAAFVVGGVDDAHGCGIVGYLEAGIGSYFVQWLKLYWSVQCQLLDLGRNGEMKGRSGICIWIEETILQVL